MEPNPEDPPMMNVENEALMQNQNHPSTSSPPAPQDAPTSTTTTGVLDIQQELEGYEVQKNNDDVAAKAPMVSPSLLATTTTTTTTTTTKGRSAGINHSASFSNTSSFRDRAGASRKIIIISIIVVVVAGLVLGIGLGIGLSRQKYPDCLPLILENGSKVRSRLGDGVCDNALSASTEPSHRLNVEACGWDGGKIPCLYDAVFFLTKINSSNVCRNKKNYM